MKKITGALAAAMIALLGALIAPTAAQAHTGDLLVSSVCNVQTGQYDLTATLKTANTTLAGETRWRVGTASFEGTPSSANGMDRGPITTQGSQTVTLGTFSIPGTTTGYGPWVYAFTKWSDTYKRGSDGQLTQKLDGKCSKPTPPAQPDDKVSYTDWVDENWECGDTTTTQHREKSVVTSIWDEIAWAWLEQDPVVTEETQQRDLADNEIKHWQTADPEGKCFNRPPAPEPETGFNVRSSHECVVPKDGTALDLNERQDWETDRYWSEEEQDYLFMDRVYGPWYTVSEEIVEDEQCAPVVIVDPPAEPVDPPKEQPRDHPKRISQLAVTGSTEDAIWDYVLWAIGIGGVVAGIIFFVGSRKWNR